MRRVNRVAAATLALPVLLVLPWSLWAILEDDTPSHPADAITMRASDFAFALSVDPANALKPLVARDKIPPVPIALAGLLLLILGPSLPALRLGGVLCYLVLIWQSHDLTRRAGGGPYAAGWAALLCGVAPVMFAWARLAYSDIYAAPVLAGCLQVMLRGDLTRRRAAALGVLLGLGLLCKLSFPVVAAVPCAWYAWRQVRRGRAPLVLAAAGIAALLGGWWVALRADVILENLSHSTQAWRDHSSRFGGHGAVEKVTQVIHYLWLYPGMPLLWLGAAAGLLLRWDLPGGSRKLLGLASLGSLALLLLFDSGIRYLVPLVAPAAALGGLALGRLSRLAASWRTAAEVCLLGGLFVWFADLHFTVPHRAFVRWDSTGMLQPTDSYTEACRAARSVARAGCAVAYDFDLLEEWLVGLNGEIGRSCSFPASSPPDDSPCVLFLGPQGLRGQRAPPPPSARLPQEARRALLRFGRQVRLDIRLLRPSELDR
jgi:hypothetical protein